MTMKSLIRITLSSSYQGGEQKFFWQSYKYDWENKNSPANVKYCDSGKSWSLHTQYEYNLATLQFLQAFLKNSENEKLIIWNLTYSSILKITVKRL